MKNKSVFLINVYLSTSRHSSTCLIFEGSCASRVISSMNAFMGTLTCASLSSNFADLRIISITSRKSITDIVQPTAMPTSNLCQSVVNDPVVNRVVWIKAAAQGGYSLVRTLDPDNDSYRGMNKVEYLALMQDAFEPVAEP